MTSLKHFGVLSGIAYVVFILGVVRFHDGYFYDGATSLLDGPWKLLLALYGVVMVMIVYGYCGALTFSRKLKKQVINGRPPSRLVNAVKHIGFIAAIAGTLLLVGFIRDSYKPRPYTFPVVGYAFLLIVAAWCLALWVDTKLNAQPKKPEDQ